jgi:hypothetical protein
MAELAVHAHTQNLSVCGLEVGDALLQVRNFLASSGRPVEGVEDEHDMLLSLELTQGKFPKLAVQREVRSL